MKYIYNTYNTIFGGAEEMTRSLNCLQYKLECLSLDSRYPHKSWHREWYEWIL